MARNPNLMAYTESWMVIVLTTQGVNETDIAEVNDSSNIRIVPNESL
ncbi:hypothetical protein FACS1894219_09710 [Clostridia bacterium]|nr:hypothetical protein FACS1894219_09710 [Clostridia bacterium]